jgi:hypothetical protein
VRSRVGLSFCRGGVWAGSRAPYARRIVAVVLGAAIGLAGCSGGSGSPVSPVVTRGSGTPTAGPGTALQQGTIVLPAGVTLAASSLTVTNSLGSATPSANGSFTLLAYSGGPQYTLVTDRAGSPVLAGFLGPNSTTIDSLSTAKLLVYFAAAFYTLPSPYRVQMIDAIATAPGFSSVQSAIESALAANPDTLASASGGSGVSAAITSFVTTLYAPNSTAMAANIRSLVKRPQDIVISPSEASGITVIQDFPGGIHFHNTFRRAAEAFFDEASFTAAGATAPTPNSKPDVVPPQEIPATTGLGNVVQSVITAVKGLFTGATQYTPVDTPTVSLPLEPGSTSTTYNVTVVGAGVPHGTPILTSEQSTAEEKILALQLFQDIIIPYVASIMITASSDQIDEALEFTGASGAISDLVDLALKEVPNLVSLVKSGRVAEALSETITTIVGSHTLQNALGEVILTDISAKSGEAAAEAAFEKAETFMLALHVASAALTGIDMAIVSQNILSSDDADRFVVTVTPNTVKLSPATATIDNSATQTLTASVPSASGTAANIVYTWSNTASAGHIFDGTSGHEDNFTSASNIVTYIANASGAGVDTVTVSAALSSAQNEPIGTAHSTITVQPSGLPQISLEPSGCVQFGFGGGSQTYSVTVTNPPAGVTLEYGFALASNQGTLSDPGATLNTFTHQLVGPSASATLNIPDLEPSPSPGTGFNGGILADLWFVTATGQLSNTWPGGKLVETSAMWGYGDVSCTGVITN